MVDPLGLDSRPSNWAYAFADLIADLDNPNPWVAATAWITVVAAGEAVVWSSIATGGLSLRAAPQVVGGAAYLAGPSSPLFGRAGGLLNSNPFLRVGWGWNDNIGREVFRIAIGGRDLPIWWHIDLFSR